MTSKEAYNYLLGLLESGGDMRWSLVKESMDKFKELIEQQSNSTLSECIKEWEILDYELINDYCSDFHFVKKIENTIYNRPIYHHFVFERINGGRYFAYSSFEKDDNFKNRQYFIISFQEHNLIHKTIKALEKMEDE